MSAGKNHNEPLLHRHPSNPILTSKDWPYPFQEREDGVYVECRAVSLTRDVPFGLGWVIEPIIQKLPKESLINTLRATRLALQGRREAAANP